MLRYFFALAIPMMLTAGCATQVPREPSSFYLTNAKGEIIATGKIALPSELDAKDASANYSLSMINKGDKLDKSEEVFARSIGRDSTGAALLSKNADSSYTLSMVRNGDAGAVMKIPSAKISEGRLSGEWIFQESALEPSGKFEAFLPEKK